MDNAEFAKKVFSNAVDLMNKVRITAEYRAKQEITKEWVYGYFAPMPFLEGQNIVRQISPAIITLDIDCWEFSPVDPETVGRYTGLTDYNGKRIFEGDIVKIHIGNIIKYGAVFYGERAARIGIRDNAGEANFSYMQQPLIREYRIVVIGNIYDTPELLKEREVIK